MTRGFEVVSSYADKDVHVPYRTTKQAAGYDFESAVDFTVPSIWKLNFFKGAVGNPAPERCDRGRGSQG